MIGFQPGAVVPAIGLGAGVGIELGYVAFRQDDAPAFEDQLQAGLVPQGVVHFRW